ncbi:hypothetical protein PUN28_015508 [Cardiocondyla obscurior]|uniref:Uncharacterized protein n=1 Tax=Cardiocondyla obscurior TaxID=286306 RepID=A0AAW2EX76_9HYME
MKNFFAEIMLILRCAWFGQMSDNSDPDSIKRVGIRYIGFPLISRRRGLARTRNGDRPGEIAGAQVFRNKGEACVSPRILLYIRAVCRARSSRHSTVPLSFGRERKKKNKKAKKEEFISANRMAYRRHRAPG